MTIEALNREDKYQKISDYIRSITNLDHKAQLLYFATNKVMEQFSTQELLNLAAILNAKLKILNQIPTQITTTNSQQRDMERKFLQMGLSKINQVLQMRKSKG